MRSEGIGPKKWKTNQQLFSPSR